MKNLENAQKVADLAAERVGLLKRLTEVETEFIALMEGKEVPVQVQIHKPEPVAGEKRRGRPPGSTNKPKEGIVIVGKESEADAKANNLPALLVTIAAEQKKALSLADFVKLVRAAGYNSKARDFVNMVYQSLLKLCKKGIMTKDQERDYLYVGDKVA